MSLGLGCSFIGVIVKKSNCVTLKIKVMEFKEFFLQFNYQTFGLDMEVPPQNGV